MRDTRVKVEEFVELSEPDKHRMAQLYEEVTARLTEMSMIVSRNLGYTVSRETQIMMRPVNAERNPVAASTTRDGIVEVHCTETSPGHFECGCYDYALGTCGPC